MEKRPAESENGENGSAENGAKKAKLDPECGRLLFCGNTDWELVRILLPVWRRNRLISVG